MDHLLDAKLEYVTRLSSIYRDIVEGRWPSQYMVDLVVGYAAVLGLPAVEVDRLHSALAGCSFQKE